MGREMCYRCFWPRAHCWCGSVTSMRTRTRFVFLMHPKEYKQEKAATGRLTHLCLSDSEIQVGVDFDDHNGVQAILGDPGLFPVLLYPGRTALNLTHPRPGELETFHESTRGRRLTVLLLDATWALGSKMLRMSPTLQKLPRVMFEPGAPSRYVIKQQPHPGCLSTLEATHEILLSLAARGWDEYPLPDQLLGLFARMQDFQLKCAADPNRAGYRRRAYRDPSERKPAQGSSGARRNRVFQAPPRTGG